MTSASILLLLLSLLSANATSLSKSIQPTVSDGLLRFRDKSQMESTALTTKAGGVVCGAVGSTQLNCPHENGVCCNDNKNCCPSDFQCVEGGSTQCRALGSDPLVLSQARQTNAAENARRAAAAQAACAAAGGSCSGSGSGTSTLGGGSLDMQQALTPVKIIHQAPPPPKITIMPTIIIQHKPADLAAWQAANAVKCAANSAAASASVPLEANSANTAASSELSGLLSSQQALAAPLPVLSQLDMPSPFALLEKAEALTDEEATARADTFLARVDTVKTAHMIARLKRAGVQSVILNKIVERARAQGRNVNEIKEMVAEDAFEDSHDPPDVDQAIHQIDTADLNLQKFSEQRASYGC